LLPQDVVWRVTASFLGPFRRDFMEVTQSNPVGGSGRLHMPQAAGSSGSACAAAVQWARNAPCSMGEQAAARHHRP